MSVILVGDRNLWNIWHWSRPAPASLTRSD